MILLPLWWDKLLFGSVLKTDPHCVAEFLQSSTRKVGVGLTPGIVLLLASVFLNGI